MTETVKQLVLFDLAVFYHTTMFATNACVSVFEARRNIFEPS
jgi:hypothetical protein